MAKTHDWTPDQRARIAAFVDSPDSDPDLLVEGTVREGNGTDATSGAECRAWRAELRSHPTSSSGDISTDKHTTTVRCHAYGRCGHPSSAVGEPAEPRRRSDGGRY